MKTAECLIIAVVLINVHANDRRISDKRLCGDPTCSHPVSLAKTLLKYSSDDARLLSFGKNVDVTIYSKSAGSKPDLWGAEIKGKRGYVPRGFVREYKILKSSLTHVVDTEVQQNEKSKDPENLTNTIPSISGTIETNKNVILSTEVPQLKSDEGSGREDLLTKTPSLEDVSIRHSAYADTSFPTFPGSGVSAEPLETETAPKLEDVTQPYEVIDGTTISYDTDGSRSETKDPVHRTVVTPNPEPNVNQDDSSSPSPLTTENPNSNEVNNNDIKNGGNDVAATGSEDSAGHIYQYLSNWISEGSGNVEVEEEEESAEDAGDDEEGEEGEDEEEEEEEANKESESNIVPEKNEIPVLTSVQESGEETESQDATNKAESILGQEVNQEKDVEEHKVESENVVDVGQNNSQEEINIEGMKDKDNLELEEESGVEVHLNDIEEADSEEQINEDKSNEVVSENPPSEEKTESVSTSDSEVIPADEKNLDAEISVDTNVSLLEDEVEKLNTVGQESPNVREGEGSETQLASSTNDSSTDVREAQEEDNIAGSIDGDDGKPENDTKNSFLNVGNIGDNLEKKSVSDIHSEFLQLDKVNRVSEPLSLNENETKDSQANTETTTLSSESEEDSSVEEFTESSLTEEAAVPTYESPVEITTEVSPDKSMIGNKDDAILVEEISAKSPGSYFPWVTDVFASLFGSSSSNTNVPEDANESEVGDAAEDIFKTDGPEKSTGKKETGWRSFWETPRESAASEMTTSATCTDPSAGIDSDCNDVAGQQPNYKGKDSTAVKESEDDAATMDVQKSFDTVICLIITGATVIIFSLGYFYLEKKRRDGSLVAKINELEKALLVSSKECLILKDDLQGIKEKLSSAENSSIEENEIVTSLNLEVEKCKMENAQLLEQVAYQEKELENATEAGLELNRMVSELLSTQNSSETMMKSVEHLQKQLDSQQNTITLLTKSLNAKTLENENLQSDLNSALEKISFLEDNVEKVNEHLTNVLSEKLKVEEEINEKNKLLDTQLNEVNAKKSAEISELQREIANLQETVNEQKDHLVTRENEVLVLQDCLKELKSVDDGVGEDKLHALLDVGHIKAELKLLTMERDTLAEKLQGEEDARKLLEDHMKIVNEELNSLRESYEEADKEKTEAQTRLEVLSNYFKEKETQLQKELGLQEAICLQKEGDATSTYEQIKCLQDEVESYRSQNDTLKKEILDQERSLKGQIASLEKKAHENWVVARQTERKLEESKQEASQLRNRLTIVEKNVTNNSINSEHTKMDDRLTGDINGELPHSPVNLGISLEDSSSSPQLFQHHDGLPTMLPGQMIPPNPFVGLPPPGIFMPPPQPPGAPYMPPPPPAPQSPGGPYMPPPPPFFPDRRPPPLGRMSSPPPHHYSPPPPDRRGTFSPYDDCSPPPSPLPMRYRSPSPHADEPSDRFRTHRPHPPPSHFKPYSSPAWDDSHGPTRSGFRPLPPSEHRNSPREPKGPALSSGHSSDSLEKSSRHSGRV